MRTPRLEIVWTCVALALAGAVVACSQTTPSAAPPSLTPSPGTAPATSAAPPTAAPGPNGTTIPVFQQPYPYGTPQASVPPTTDGKAPIVKRIDTDLPYVFITIDDGAVRNPVDLELMRSSGVRPTMFLNTKYAQGHADFFTSLHDQASAAVEDHTADHPNLQGKPYAFQKQEICGNADFLGRDYGKRPALFRPPFGNYDQNTRKAAADCGMKALVLWTAAVNDGVVQFQQGNELRRGDIVLMHFRNTFVQDFTAFLTEAKKDGLTPVPLEDFLSPEPMRH
ncbi:MAG TPA: polysaccharide deacetylase family protein [Pseudonocardiaceae bacterium]|nr:polysaccharide deacetylase family protein [Pseudonocardiaceae bacterium]